MRKFDDGLTDGQRQKAAGYRTAIEFDNVTKRIPPIDPNFNVDRYLREVDLRTRFKYEYAFRDLIDRDKELIRFKLLLALKFDPEKPFHKNTLDTRILYHQDYNAMAYNDSVQAYFQYMLNSGHEFSFTNSRRDIYEDII